MADYVIRTRSSHPFALVKYLRSAPEGPLGIRRVVGAELVGYAASEGPTVQARARRLGAIIVPIDRKAGRIVVAGEVSR